DLRLVVTGCRDGILPRFKLCDLLNDIFSLFLGLIELLKQAVVQSCLLFKILIESLELFFGVTRILEWVGECFDCAILEIFDLSLSPVNLLRIGKQLKFAFKLFSR